MGVTDQIDQGGQAVTEYGRNESQIETISIDLSSARDKQELPISGSFLWAYFASSLTANIDIYLNSLKSDPMNFKLNMSINGFRFNRVYISNTAQAGQSMSFAYSKESDLHTAVTNALSRGPYLVDDSTPIDVITRSGSTMSITGTVSVSFANSYNFYGLERVSVASVAPNKQQIFSSHPSRRWSHIISDPANTAPVIIGDSSLTATKGLPIWPSEKRDIPTGANLYAALLVAGPAEILWLAQTYN